MKIVFVFMTYARGGGGSSIYTVSTRSIEKTTVALYGICSHCGADRSNIDFSVSVKKHRIENCSCFYDPCSARGEGRSRIYSVTARERRNQM